ncbi:helix-turn-helix domain-containing protein [Microvirga massiliensis]|uniref:helix-turn-helix domain-containing protein n=1 Tax=Microvirga massiliensis TaxID=1033741 RepID=UPI00062B60BA|nr:XRE family transcriptional regulator [Microvirga massiliensis]
MTEQTFASVRDALTDTPEEAENMRVRSQLMTELRQHLAERKLTQGEAAKVMGVTQPRVSDLLRGKIDRFSIDMLVNMASRAGLHTRITLEAA